MAIALVQGPKVKGANGVASVTVGAGEGWAAPTAGNILLAWAVSSVSTNPPLNVAGFTQIAPTFNATVDTRGEWWIKTAAGTETSITLSCDVSIDNLFLEVYEFSGLTTTVDNSFVVNALTSAGTSLSTGSISTVNADTLLLAGWGLKATGSPWVSATNSFILGAGTLRSGSAYRITSSSGSYDTTATWTTARQAVSVMVGLRASGGGTGLAGSAAVAASAAASLTGGGGITRTAATDAELVSALQASNSGETIKLTVSRDYTVLVSDVDCRPNGVTVVNDTGINARIKTGTASNQGFQDCFGINITGVRLASTKFWGGGNIHILNSPLASGLYFQGNHANSSLRGSTLTTGGFGITLDGRRGALRGYVENFIVDGNTFTQIGVDPYRAFGIRNCEFTNNTVSDVSSYRYSGDQTANRLHSDGMDITQVDGLIIRGNTFDLIEWQGIILKNHGYFLGWPEHLTRGVVIDDNTFSRIGFTNFPEIGTTGAGVGIYIQDCHTVTVKNNVDGGNIDRAALNHFHLWHSEPYLDPVYGTYSSVTDSITYLVQMKVFYGNNDFVKVLATPPSGAWQSSNGPALLPLSEGDTPIAGKASIASSATATLTPSDLPLRGVASITSHAIASITPPGEGILISAVGSTSSGATGLLLGGDSLLLAHAGTSAGALAVLTVVQQQLYFSPPTLPTVVFHTPYSSPAVKRLFSHYTPSPRGQTVLKISGVYQTFQSPTSAQVISAQEVYLGGHVYPVDDTTANALIAAGFTVGPL